MPDEEKKTVDIDTSGPGAEIDLQEDKKENEIEVENETVENNTESNDSSEKSDEQLDVQAEDGIRDQPRSRGLGDVYKRQIYRNIRS